MKTANVIKKICTFDKTVIYFSAQSTWLGGQLPKNIPPKQCFYLTSRISTSSPFPILLFLFESPSHKQIGNQPLKNWESYM
jgi:hypothetical protein